MKSKIFEEMKSRPKSGLVACGFTVCDLILYEIYLMRAKADIVFFVSGACGEVRYRARVRDR